jgi:hypothetical protein
LLPVSWGLLRCSRKHNCIILPSLPMVTTIIVTMLKRKLHIIVGRNCYRTIEFHFKPECKSMKWSYKTGNHKIVALKNRKAIKKLYDQIHIYIVQDIFSKKPNEKKMVKHVKVSHSAFTHEKKVHLH